LKHGETLVIAKVQFNSVTNTRRPVHMGENWKHTDMQLAYEIWECFHH